MASAPASAIPPFLSLGTVGCFRLMLAKIQTSSGLQNDPGFGFCREGLTSMTCRLEIPCRTLPYCGAKQPTGTEIPRLSGTDFFPLPPKCDGSLRSERTEPQLRNVMCSVAGTSRNCRCPSVSGSDGAVNGTDI